MDLGSLFSGLGFTPPNSSNPPSNIDAGTASNTSSITNWIIIIIILIVAFRYGNLKSMFYTPFYDPSNQPYEPEKKKHKKHRKHYKEETFFNEPYYGYPIFQ